MQGRIQIQGVRLRREREETKVVAELAWENQVVSGEAREEGASTVRLAALATVEAMNRLLPEGYRLSLEGIEVIHLRQNDAIVVHVALLHLGRREDLAGSTFLVGRHPLEIGAEAVLDAVQRRVEGVLGGQKPVPRGEAEDRLGL